MSTTQFLGTSVKDYALHEIASISASLAVEFADDITIDAEDLLTLRMAVHLARTVGASRAEVNAAMKQEV